MTAEFRNFYDLLGVPRNATKEQIRDAYKELARVYHPDSHFYDEILEGAKGMAAPTPAPESDLFKAITEAYNVLSNEKSRQDYDQTIPGDLPQWEGNDREDWHSERGAMSLHGAGKARYASSAFGNFGVVKNPSKSAFDEEAMRSVRPVSEMIKVKRGFWWKVRWLFFLES